MSSARVATRVADMDDVSLTGLADGYALTWVNSTSKWTPAPAAGGSPGGSSGQFQYNNAGSFGGAPGVTRSSGNPLVVTAQAASDVPVKAVGAGSQSGNYFEARDSSNALKFSVASSGAVYSASSVQLGSSLLVGIAIRDQFNLNGGIAMNTGGSGGYAVRCFSQFADEVTLVCQMNGSQSADPIRVMNSALNTTVFRVTKDGGVAPAATTGAPGSAGASGEIRPDPSGNKIWVYTTTGWKSVAVS